MNLVFFCRGSVHQLQPEQQHLTAIHHTKSILFIVPSSTHLCIIHLKHTHTALITRHHRSRQSQKPAAKVTSNFVQHFQSGVAGHHGYVCNLMLHYLRVSAVFSFFHITVSNFIHSFAVWSPPKKADVVCCCGSHCCPWPLTCCPRACVAILSALRNLQMKIRRLELEKRQAELNMRTTRRAVSHTHLQSDKVTQTCLSDPTGGEQETSGRPSCNQGGCRRTMCSRVSDLCLYTVDRRPQRWSLIWLLQSLAVRSWSDSWKSWGGSWPVRLVLVSAVLHAWPSDVSSRSERSLRQTYAEYGCLKDCVLRCQENGLMLLLREE